MLYNFATPTPIDEDGSFSWGALSGKINGLGSVDFAYSKTDTSGDSTMGYACKTTALEGPGTAPLPWKLKSF